MSGINQNSFSYQQGVDKARFYKQNSGHPEKLGSLEIKYSNGPRVDLATLATAAETFAAGFIFGLSGGTEIDPRELAGVINTIVNGKSFPDITAESMETKPNGKMGAMELAGYMYCIDNWDGGRPDGTINMKNIQYPRYETTGWPDLSKLLDTKDKLDQIRIFFNEQPR